MEAIGRLKNIIIGNDVIGVRFVTKLLYFAQAAGSIDELHGLSRGCDNDMTDLRNFVCGSIWRY